MRPWPDVFCRDMPEDEEGKGAALSGVEDCSRYDDRDIILTKKYCHATQRDTYASVEPKEQQIILSCHIELLLLPICPMSLNFAST